MKKVLYYYCDYLEDFLLRAGIKFRIIEDIVPPILNKQRWFVSEAVSGHENEFEEDINWFARMTLNEFPLSIFCVKERQQDLLKRVYFFDFRLPAQIVKERFYATMPSRRAYEIALNPFPVKSFPSSEKSNFFSSGLSLYDEIDGITIIPTKLIAPFVNMSFIIKSILEGHKIPFKVVNYFQFRAMGGKSSIYFQLELPNYEFYYDNGIIKLPYDISKIDNYFLAGLEELIKTFFQIIIKVARRRKLSDFYKDLINKLSKNIYISVSEAESDIRIYYGENTYTIEEKLPLFQKIGFFCSLIIEHFLGKIPELAEVTKDIEEIEKRKEFLIRTLKIIDEMLSTVI